MNNRGYEISLYYKTPAMPQSFIITNARIVNEGQIFSGSVAVENGIIVSVDAGSVPVKSTGFEIIDAKGNFLVPGVMDCHVHFREPGVTRKADIASESRAAVAGGVTSFMEMPNTVPQTTSLQLLEEKFELAGQKSLANYSFFLGATNDNIEEIEKADPARVCGVKVFFGASTGNMLVDNLAALEQIFSRSPLLVAAHCEDETMIRLNSARIREKFGEDIPAAMHPLIRSAEACYKSTELAINLAKKFNTRLHITHLSTAKELGLLDNSMLLFDKRITAETCTHYLWFCDEDYARLGKLIKVNPAIKTAADRTALLNGLLSGYIDIISTDHAPHLAEEKNQTYYNSPSGTPLVQHSLPAMLELWKQGKITLEKVVNKMCHAPAICYRVEKRGFIRPGYFADLVLFDPNSPWTVSKENIFYKCGWSAFEGQKFNSQITHTWVNGHLAYAAGISDDSIKGQRLTFTR
jgi:dihydroorotase